MAWGYWGWDFFWVGGAQVEELRAPRGAFCTKELQVQGCREWELGEEAGRVRICPQKCILQGKFKLAGGEQGTPAPSHKV